MGPLHKTRDIRYARQSTNLDTRLQLHILETLDAILDELKDNPEADNVVINR